MALKHLGRCIVCLNERVTNTDLDSPIPDIVPIYVTATSRTALLPPLMRRVNGNGAENLFLLGAGLEGAGEEGAMHSTP